MADNGDERVFQVGGGDAAIRRDVITGEMDSRGPPAKRRTNG